MKLPCVAADPAGRPCRTCVQMCLQGNGINRRSQIRLVDFGVEEELDLYCQLSAAHAAPPQRRRLCLAWSRCTRHTAGSRRRRPAQQSQGAAWRHLAAPVARPSVEEAGGRAARAKKKGARRAGRSRCKRRTSGAEELPK